MKTHYFKILLYLISLFFVEDVQSQYLDSLGVIDSKYDSILKSDGEAMNTLFYKHDNDVLINNLGPYGSPFYYPTTFFLHKKNLIKKPNSFNEKLYKLSGFRPYSNITFINASRKEQQFSIKHVQEFGKLLVLDFVFFKSSSPGAYLNQEANNTVFTGTLKYTSKKGNYDITFSNGIFKNFYQENGGLFDTENYELSVFDDARTYPVNLNSSNSFKKKYNYQLEQRLDLFKINSDSISKDIIYLKHKIGYTTQQKVFFDEDPFSNIYNNIYLDSAATIDSIYNNCFSNTAFVGYRNNDFSVEIFGEYEQNKYSQSFGIDTLYNNLYVGIGSSFIKENFNAEFITKYGLDGYVKGDIESEILLSYNKEKYDLNGGLIYFLNEPVLKFKNYTSNHFIWNNPNFDKQSVLGLNINFKLKEMQIEFKAETKLLTNTLYYDSLAIASQDDGTASISSFSLAKNYKLLNFHFRTAFIYQLTSDQLLFPLPQIVGRQVLYYQKMIFKGAMKFQMGLGFSYSTNYFGYAYMPAINEYTKQSGGTELGYYPRVDVFINTQLKRAQIFLKYEHFNAGRSLQKSYITPGYAPMSKSLKFGVSWNMFD